MSAEVRKIKSRFGVLSFDGEMLEYSWNAPISTLFQAIEIPGESENSISLEAIEKIFEGKSSIEGNPDLLICIESKFDERLNNTIYFRSSQDTEVKDFVDAVELARKNKQGKGATPDQAEAIPS